MAIQNEIRRYLTQGYTPQQVIAMGYRKSTVYKVYENVKSYETSITKPDWLVHFLPHEPRCVPGNSISINCNFQNTSDRDLYLTRVGLSTEWMENNTWLAQDVNDLIKRGWRRKFSFIIAVPEDITLGEYELRFGIEGQYLPVKNYYDQQQQTVFSEPIIFHVKHPFKNFSIFISHSTEDLHIVRELEKRLDCYGIEAKIAEDIPQPGSELNRKFQQLIRESTLFLAIITEKSIRSDWVIKETNYASEIGKPSILLKEKNVQIETTIEWVEFSEYDDHNTIFCTVMDSINNLQKRGVFQSPIAPILGLGIAAFLFGLFFGGPSKS